MAAGYLLWPLAALDLLRGADGANLWSRLHARQALVFGILWSLLGLAVVAFPLLVVVVFGGISPDATVVVYGLGIALDLAAAGTFVTVGLRYYARTARGELFSIPAVTPIVDRFFRLPPS